MTPLVSQKRVIVIDAGVVVPLTKMREEVSHEMEAIVDLCRNLNLETLSKF